MAKTKRCVVTRFISFFLWAPRWIIFITLGSYLEPTQLGSDWWIMERRHARHLQCERPVKIPHLLSVTPLPLHSDHILVLKIGPQSGRVQALELTFGKKKKNKNKNKKKDIHWPDCEERKTEFLLDYFTGLWGLLVTTVSAYLWLTLGLTPWWQLSQPQGELQLFHSQKLPGIFYPTLESLLTRDYVSLISESPGLPTPPDPENRS